MFNYFKQKLNSQVLLFCIMMIITTFVFWNNSKNNFLCGSESLTVSMVAAGRYNFDIGNRIYGLGFIGITDVTDITDLLERASYVVERSYNVYANPELYNNYISEYLSQIGLQGWIFYWLARLGVPRPVAAFRLGCCLALAIVLVLICFELYKKYGLLFSSVFYIVSVSSSWLTNFAPDLYWVTFTWFIPMLLGLFCLNNLNKRIWLYPLFFFAIFIKAACGYEYMTVVMLSSIMFLVVEWICLIRKDKKQSMLLFKTIFLIGIMSLLGFVTAISIHAYMRGDGNILNGLNDIYQHNMLPRTFGNVAENASILDVLIIYFRRGGGTGTLARCLLIIGVFILFYKHTIKRQPINKEFWLFATSFLTCISWFILGKNHSYIHTQMNYVLWHMGFIQVGVYTLLKNVLQFSDKGRILFRNFFERLLMESYRDL